jgi:hypothetical protein
MAQWYEAIHASKRYRLLEEKRDVKGNVYVYLKGVSSLAAGSWVTFDEGGVTTLLAANAVGPVAISMSANTDSTKFSWFQRVGVNLIASTDTTAADKALYIDGTSGRADDAVVSGDLICGAYSQAADSSNVCTVRIDRPYVTDVLG